MKKVAIPLLLGVLLVLLVGVISAEACVLISVCFLCWFCLNEATPVASQKAFVPSVSAQRVSTRHARKATNTKKREDIDDGVVVYKQASLQPLVPQHPSENVLDDALACELSKRSITRLDYHNRALPAAIAAASRELKTRDPSIVSIDRRETCVRNLGEV